MSAPESSSIHARPGIASVLNIFNQAVFARFIALRLWLSVEIGIFLSSFAHLFEVLTCPHRRNQKW